MKKIKMEILYSVFNNIKRVKLWYLTGVDTYQLNSFALKSMKSLEDSY